MLVRPLKSAIYTYLDSCENVEEMRETIYSIKNRMKYEMSTAKPATEDSQEVHEM